MASLGDLGESVTTELSDRVERLVAKIEEKAPDFMEIAFLSDAVGELVDKVSSLYSELDQTLSSGFQGGAEQDDGDTSDGQEKRSRGRQGRRQGSQRSAQSDSSDEDTTKEELLERARELKVEGRSSMDKEELAQAVEAEESLTKEELLERAQEAEIDGRSSMNKEELREAVIDSRT